MRKFSVGLVVLRKARVSKSKQTDGGYLLFVIVRQYEYVKTFLSGFLEIFAFSV